MPKPVVLLILDGWGESSDQKDNAIFLADTPHYDRIMSTYPSVHLNTSGLAVGLPEGQMGNSEVGHLNIGSGRVVYQDLTRLDQEIRTGHFRQNPILLEGIKKAVVGKRSVHLMGLLSDGGVHSHIHHLLALLDMCKEQGVKSVLVHGFLDGRDVPPKSALQYVKVLEEHMDSIGLGRIATIQGRYYTMDRDKRWDRVEKGYQAMVNGFGPAYGSALEAIEAGYRTELTDEFILPSVIDGYEGMMDEDSLIFFNFRGDRAREISEVFLRPGFDAFPIRRINIHYVCMTEYDETLVAPIAYPPERLTNTLGAYLGEKGMRQVRIAETEKYAHVTFFFNGGVETPNPGEDRILVPSPKVATYDQKPEMSIYEVTQKVLEVLEGDQHNVIIINYANGDMVGHSGKLEAAIKAVEAVDACIGKVSQKVLEKNGVLMITADHGNCEQMLDKTTKAPHTAHTTNPVPFIVVSEPHKKLRESAELSLRDISPTILGLLDLTVPKEMTGKSIIV